jgi:hypothetical protein
LPLLCGSRVLIFRSDIERVTATPAGQPGDSRRSLMAEENTDDKSGTENTDEFKPITSQEELTKLIGERINKVKSKYADYDDVKAKAAEFDKAQEASKSELQKAADRAAQAEKERDELRLAHARAEVALDKGLTPTQAKRLVGSTKEELEADADELLADLGTPSKAKADPKSLKSGSSGSSEQLTGKEKAAAALRQMRTGT